MSKPETLRDLLAGGHIDLAEVRVIARSLFDGKTTAAGPEGYVITAVAYEDLPDHVQGFINKAILAFSVENVLDAGSDDDKEDSDNDGDESPGVSF